MNDLLKPKTKKVRKKNIIKKIVRLQAIKQLVRKAKTRDQAFISQFNYVYKSFSKKLSQQAPELIISELTLCAYIKIGFSTKEIAYYTNSSCRSVESKKFRIRKKLRLQKKENLDNYLMNL